MTSESQITSDDFLDDMEISVIEAKIKMRTIKCINLRMLKLLWPCQRRKNMTASYWVMRLSTSSLGIKSQKVNGETISESCNCGQEWKIKPQCWWGNIIENERAENWEGEYSTWEVNWSIEVQQEVAFKALSKEKTEEIWMRLQLSHGADEKLAKEDSITNGIWHG